MKFFEILVKKYYYFSQVNQVLVYKVLGLDQVGRAMAGQQGAEGRRDLDLDQVGMAQATHYILSGMAFVI